MSKQFSVDSLPSKSIKIVALAFSIILLSFSLLFFKCVDYISNSRKSLDNNTEEVSLNKQLAYRVDAFSSATPYAKPLALLVATLLLICLGGLAFFGVRNDNLADSLGFLGLVKPTQGIMQIHGGFIHVLDAILAHGSELWIYNDVTEKERERRLIDGGLDTSRLVNITLVHREGNAVIRRNLESLPLESFDSILILADESVEDAAIKADSRSLATLLLIRDIQAKRLPIREAMIPQAYRSSFSKGSWIGEMQQASDKSVIISEFFYPRTKNLLSMSKTSDYVLSNELVSMALGLWPWLVRSEDRQINDVLEELFAEEGNELHIRGADLYLYEGEDLSFYEIILHARQKRAIVIVHPMQKKQ